MPRNLLPIRSGRRGGDGFGYKWVLITGPVDDAIAERMAKLVLSRPGGPLRVDRRTRRRVLVVRRVG